jgi:hypothetical protein
MPDPQGSTYRSYFGVRTSGATSPNSLWAAPFDANGNQRGVPTLLASEPGGSGVGITNLRSAGSANGVVFEWLDRTGTHYATGGAAASTLSLHTFTTSPTSFYPIPAAWSSGSGLLWYTFTAVAGVQFDAASGEPLRSNSLGIEEEHIPLPWLTNPQYLVAGTGIPPELDTFQLNLDRLWPGTLEVPLSIVTEFSPGTGPLATQSNARLLARGTFPLAAKLVSLPGSVLAISNAPDGTVSVTSVWRRP